MSDDRARTVDSAPWDEPRGPHPPDIVRDVPALAWVFIAMSAARLWTLVDTANVGPAPDPLLVGGTVANAVGSLSVLLLPAALLIRRPDAPRRAPILVFGVITVGFAEALQALGPGLHPFFDSVSADADLAPVPPITLAYGAVGLLVALAGVIGIGAGLHRARRFPSHRRQEFAGLILVLAGIVAVARLAATLTFLPSATDSIAYSTYFWVAAGTGIATILAWAYLTLVTAMGVRAGEGPATAWGLGVLAGVLTLVGYLLFDVMTLRAAPVADIEGSLSIVSIALASGPASLLLAVAAGLPSLEPSPEVADD